MNLDQLVHWRLEGTPDVFTEVRDRRKWRVIHTGGNQGHHAGFLQTVTFQKPVESLLLSVIATLYTRGGGLMLRLGIDPGGGVAPLGPRVLWSDEYGPDHGWNGQKAQILRHVVHGLNTERVTVFLESVAKWKTDNTSRWRDVQLEVEYADPDPEPDPDPDQGIPGQIVQTLIEIQERLDRIDDYLAQWDRGQAWVDEYNRSLIDE